MRFDTEMDRRLQNWARWWFQRKDGGSMATASMAERVDRSGWDAPTVIPTLDAEAEETGNLVLQLPSVERYAIEAWYLTGGGVAQRCRKAQVSETEMRKRVATGQRRLAQLLRDKREAAERERERLKVLQHQARA